LLDTAREHQARIIDVMRDVPGLRMFGVGGDPASATAVTITVCDDKTGTDESIKRAAATVKELLPDANIAPPQILQGEIIYRLTANELPTGPGAYLRLAVFHNAAPLEGFGEHEAELRAALSPVPGWLSYTAFVDETTGDGVILHAAADKASFDKVFDAHAAWVQANWPGFQADPPPDVILITGMYRFDAKPAAA
jgi:hypothetical protein